jgi:GDP-L-fucose synthase
MEEHAKIYVAGHRGLVGSAIKKALEDKGYQNLIYKASKELDLRRQSDTEEFFQKESPEYVFLAAAKVGGILANDTYKAEFIYDNMAIAINIIQSSYKYGVKKLLNLGSSCIYPKFAPQPMKEQFLLTGPLEPTNEPYAIAKISAIKLVRYYNEQYGTNFLSVMPTNLYGPNDNFNLETAHVLPALIRKFHLAKLLREGTLEALEADIRRYPLGFGLDREAENHKIDNLPHTLSKLGIFKDKVALWGSGEVYREFLFVEDLAEACVFLMENFNAWDLSARHPLSPKKVTSTLSLEDYFLNIGTGEDIKVKDLAQMIKEIVGFKGDIFFDSSKPDGTPKKLLDVTNIKSLGWQAKTSLEEGIIKTYTWYKALDS